MSRLLRIRHSPPTGTPLLSRILVGLLLLAGVGIAIYPMTARWRHQLTQSELVDTDSVELSDIEVQARADALASARAYNDSLTTGAAFDPFTQGIAGTGSEPYRDYLSELEGMPSGVMARILIPKIEVDLPIYHGTTDDVLLQGVGHLFGTALPVGGEGTRSTLTAHSGLANAVMFTFLDRLEPGDIFHIEVYGERLSYEVVETKDIYPIRRRRSSPSPAATSSRSSPARRSASTASASSSPANASPPSSTPRCHSQHRARSPASRGG